MATATDKTASSESYRICVEVTSPAVSHFLSLLAQERVLNDIVLHIAIGPRGFHSPEGRYDTWRGKLPEFHGCSAQTPVDSCAEQHASSALVPRIFRAGGRRFCADGRGFSVGVSTDFPCGFGLKMVETRRRTSCATTLKDGETRRNDRSNYHCKNTTYLDMKYE